MGVLFYLSPGLFFGWSTYFGVHASETSTHKGSRNPRGMRFSRSMVCVSNDFLCRCVGSPTVYAASNAKALGVHRQTRVSAFRTMLRLFALGTLLALASCQTAQVVDGQQSRETILSEGWENSFDFGVQYSIAAGWKAVAGHP